MGNRFIVKKYQTALPCRDCGGTRLRPEALRVTLGGRTIAEVAAMFVRDAAEFLGALQFTDREREIAGPALAEIQARLTFLLRVDLGYLTLDRLTRTLSGGEAQRIELANALGANLADTLYVLDEPTVGLHPRDSDRLAALLGELAGRGNTLVVVEHEPLLMRVAEHVVDLGPGAGALGGRVLYAGAGGDALRAADTETARYLRGEKRVARRRREGEPPAFLTVEGATHHNLKDVDVRFPIGRLTAVTGVSGSGKSSLVEEVLYRAALAAIEDREGRAGRAHRAIRGLQRFKRVVLVDQSPIGKTPRSCPVTYLGAYAALREIYARQTSALARGLRMARSRSTRRGAVRAVRRRRLGDDRDVLPCRPAGALRVLRGARFRREVLDVRYRGINIREALDLTADQAFLHFGREPRFTRRLQILRRVGLGYLRLGQPANQLSGGEAQRLKIARELGEKAGGPALYLLDEPTVGLHFADVQRLLEVLDDLDGARRHGDRRRAQPRRDPQRRLDRGPGPGRRRRRRAAHGGGPARGDRGRAGFLDRPLPRGSGGMSLTIRRARR